MDPWTHYFLAPLLGGLACFAVLSLMLRTPLVGVFGDAPNHRTVHMVTIPRFGGLAILFSFLIFALFQFSGWLSTDKISVLPGLTLSAIFLALAGSWDDIRQIGFKAKFLLQFTLAGLLVFGLGHHFDTLSLFGFQFEMGGYGKVLSLIFLVGVMNAFNIIDGIDGLASGVSGFAFAAVALIAY
jgi:UDP-GlcNAc:undecaprenyl-phosphate GlcNAc-1-phosphate transferase